MSINNHESRYNKASMTNNGELYVSVPKNRLELNIGWIINKNGESGLFWKADDIVPSCILLNALS